LYVEQPGARAGATPGADGPAGGPRRDGDDTVEGEFREV
jgi:hypothetical protein